MLQSLAFLFFLVQRWNSSCSLQGPAAAHPPLAPSALSVLLLNILSSHYQVPTQTRTFAHAACSSQSILTQIIVLHFGSNGTCLGKFCCLPWPSPLLNSLRTLGHSSHGAWSGSGPGICPHQTMMLPEGRAAFWSTDMSLPLPSSVNICGINECMNGLGEGGA